MSRVRKLGAWIPLKAQGRSQAIGAYILDLLGFRV